MKIERMMVKRSTSVGFYHHLVLGIFSTVVSMHRLKIRFHIYHNEK